MSPNLRFYGTTTVRSNYIIVDDSSYLPWFQPKCDTIHLTEKKFYCMFNYRKKFLWNTNIEIYGTIYMTFHHPFGKYFRNRTRFRMHRPSVENSLVLIVASVKYNRRSEKNIAFFFFHINLRPGARTSCNKGVMQKLKRHGNGGSCLKKQRDKLIEKTPLSSLLSDSIVTTRHSRYPANNLVCIRRINRTTYFFSVRWIVSHFGWNQGR
jgi:hypothetical protein